MPVEKIGKLETLVTPFEFKHIESFPAFLRYFTLGAHTFFANFDECLKPNAKVAGCEGGFKPSELKRFEFHRVIDNKPITMTGADFWIHLNYQIMHLTDFVPSVGW